MRGVSRTQATIRGTVALLMMVVTCSVVGASEYPPDAYPIAQVQGAAHRSPVDGRRISGVLGVVTGTAVRGFYMQSPIPDDDPATSEGLFVQTIRVPEVTVGDLVTVAGRVAERYPGGSGSANLSVTTMTVPRVTVIGRNHRLPDPVRIGSDRRPATETISDDSTGNVEDSPFDPRNDAIDFYESLEGMLVRVEDPVSVGTTHTVYGETWVVADDGRWATGRTERGGIAVTEGDFNPERILIDYLEETQVFTQERVRSAEVGDRFVGPIDGILAYSYGNYKVIPTGQLPALAERGLERQQTSLSADARTLLVAAFNVQNLGGTSPQAKFDDLGRTIAIGLAGPDVVALAEIQDNDGPRGGAIVAADQTAARLIESIEAAGGPADYRYIDIPPEAGGDGGQPGGNIRVGFLYRSSRVELRGDPWRVDPTNRAFGASRKPLAARFAFAGHEVTMIACHLNSKGGDAPLFGKMQPPVFASEQQRGDQAAAIAQTAGQMLDADPDAPVIVLGDLNDFAFSAPLQVLMHRPDGSRRLHNLADELLPPTEVYSYVYEGNSQALDHILVSRSLIDAGPRVEIVHRYCEYLYEDRHTDHDPVVASFTF